MEKDTKQIIDDTNDVHTLESNDFSRDEGKIDIQKQELIEFIQSIDCPQLLDYLTGIKDELICR